jgi:hypothetical protein
MFYLRIGEVCRIPEVEPTASYVHIPLGQLQLDLGGTQGGQLARVHSVLAQQRIEQNVAMPPRSFCGIIVFERFRFAQTV